MYKVIIFCIRQIVKSLLSLLRFFFLKVWFMFYFVLYFQFFLHSLSVRHACKCIILLILFYLWMCNKEWVELSWVELNWFELNWIELNWIWMVRPILKWLLITGNTIYTLRIVKVLPSLKGFFFFWRAIHLDSYQCIMCSYFYLRNSWLCHNYY